MTIYIASSWKNQHAVEMLTELLRELDHKVLSFVENSYEENLHEGYANFEKWLKSENASRAFEFDTKGATTSDLVIYIAPSGKDAAAEVGAAWGNNVPIIGLAAKGEDFGLMRKMMKEWYSRYTEVLDFVKEFQRIRLVKTIAGID